MKNDRQDPAEQYSTEEGVETHAQPDTNPEFDSEEVVEVPREGDEERRRLLRPRGGRNHHAAARAVRVGRGLLQDAHA